MDYTQTEEYKLIAAVYGDRTAKRSGVPLINHINEGIEIMVGRGASDYAIRAYIVHPIYQDDASIAEVAENGSTLDPNVVLRAVEYRRTANSYLCRPSTDDWDIARIEAAVGLLLPDVKEMLIADKIQNQKDFIAHHLGTHARSEQLDAYFKNWRVFLGV